MRGHASFQRVETRVDASCDAPPGSGQRHDKRPAICRADLAGDETAVHQPIQNARQRGPFVRQAFVQLCDRGRARCREQRQNVRFALRQLALRQRGKIEPDSVRRTVNSRNECQHHLRRIRDRT